MSAALHAARWKPARLLVLAPVLLAGAPAFAQQLGTARPVEVPVIQLIAGLILCSLAAFAIVMVMKKRGAGGTPVLPLLRWRTAPGLPAGGIKVLETRRISVHADLCRFTAGNREYLVIVSSGATTVLRDEPLAPSPAGGAPGGAA